MRQIMCSITYKTVDQKQEANKGTFHHNMLEEDLIKPSNLLSKLFPTWVCFQQLRDMLETLKNKMPHLESLHEFQGSLKSELMFKKFLFVLDDIWEKEEEQD
ncbi:hypothetical protein IEQ34_008195 [Dendrobium chrysotoxum]|uniref:Uncharacterized protein n=1 Tax=Dendrobium chrysotoxum TaxID=161865 RepID=A0AAV7H7N7_DENCH|nr:hypothetical protein IEQ34_008195 [Dendrobium chrysotoxum]